MKSEAQPTQPLFFCHVLLPATPLRALPAIKIYPPTEDKVLVTA